MHEYEYSDAELDKAFERALGMASASTATETERQNYLYLCGVREARRIGKKPFFEEGESVRPKAGIGRFIDSQNSILSVYDRILPDRTRRIKRVFFEEGEWTLLFTDTPDYRFRAEHFEPVRRKRESVH